ncbi:MAG: hypothetical protein QNL62_11165 [Gammaproteobacteria bacterium]|nr:hypothetical protein [Gammaproteobacteria bacterium]
MAIKTRQPGKKVKKPAHQFKYALYLLVIITLLLITAYFFVDLQEMQYFIEDIISPPDEDREKQLNFIELTLFQIELFFA